MGKLLNKKSLNLAFEGQVILQSLIGSPAQESQRHNVSLHTVQEEGS